MVSPDLIMTLRMTMRILFAAGVFRSSAMLEDAALSRCPLTSYTVTPCAVRLYVSWSWHKFNDHRVWQKYNYMRHKCEVEEAESKD